MDMTKLPEQTGPKVLIIGAYGLIGYGITKRLMAEGCAVTGFGRDLHVGQKVLPEIAWIKGDMAKFRDATDWAAVLDGFSVVVNCSGALQDGPQDDLAAIHHYAVAALACACATADVALVQISAVGAKLDASTEFLASKARGDAAIRASAATHYIFRPGLVLASNAYGGTTLLRMLAAVPCVQPIATPHAAIQTVALEDVAGAVAGAVAGKIPAPFESDLVETETHTLREVVAAMRHWLGFPCARFELVVPRFGLVVVSKLADALSRLGWRSPMRSTAVAVLTEGVRGNNVDLTQFGLPPISSLGQTLSNLPVGAQDRLFARMALLMPVVVISLSLFWLASGVIGLARVSDAAHLLEMEGWPSGMAIASVVVWAIVDIVIGVAFAVRKYARVACWAAVGVSVFYLVASTLAVPSLWIDPLGPLVKIVPGMILAIVARAALETR